MTKLVSFTNQLRITFFGIYLAQISSLSLVRVKEEAGTFEIQGSV